MMKGLGSGKDGHFEKAGSIFLDENGEGPDVRIRETKWKLK